MITMHGYVKLLASDQVKLEGNERMSDKGQNFYQEFEVFSKRSDGAPCSINLAC